ncbi:hypothetical protein ES703_120027 [subsurface metagenome]
MVVIGIQNYLKIVIIIDNSIAPHFSGGNLVRLRIITLDADVKILLVIEKSDFGFFGCWRLLFWLALGELPLKQGILPGRIV